MFGWLRKSLDVEATTATFQVGAQGKLARGALLEAAKIAASFLDGMLIHGDAARAWKSIDVGKVGARPMTAALAVTALRGTGELVFKPYELREPYALAVNVLFAAVKTADAEPYRAWLAEGMLIGYTAEKRVVATALNALGIPSEVAKDLAVRLAATICEKKSYERALESAFLLQDEGVALGTIEALADNATACALLAGQRLYFSDAGDCRLTPGRENDVTMRLRRLLTHASPAVLNASLALLDKLALPADGMMTEIVGIAAACRGGDDWRFVLERLQLVISKARVRLSPEQLKPFRSIKLQAEFWYNQERLAAPRITARRSTDGSLVLEGNVTELLPVPVSAGSVLAAYQHVRWATDRTEWILDEDGFGVAKIEGDQVVSLHALPVQFPVAPTGAAGAKRQISSVALADGELFLALQTPFSREGAWGEAVLLVSFRLADGSWRAWRPDAGGGWQAVPAEAELPIAGSGSFELRCDGERLVPVEDSTAYAFEDAPSRIKALPPLPVRAVPLHAPEKPVVAVHLKRWSLDLQ